ncbi:hypothetical protein CSQ92_21180 [Janthinobacterium sp. BJB446]|uniref:DUF4297 family anti-phage-associated protein n=1 Tax=Janthinobacterium sp. BJB446 TaxID=2048009 RepID=UPI000C0EBFFE|nr:DUF4297 family anti-phage-associated protein [Janthinobacterium sp. BJB446]PHV20642.1 hypothetical protein CSQ92_21180 [Janthinobacterium sp. BJB446]
MVNRSANATIKGYFYQFDHTIERLLEAAAPQSSIVVEGIEDIDFDDGDDSALVQCKYYEGTEYNHSVIKDAVIHMLRHFHSKGCPPTQESRYRIYGHYQNGQDKLSATFDLDFLKKNFLTYDHKKVTHEVHLELGMTDAQLETFLKLLDIDVRAPSYDEQQKRIVKLLVAQISGCKLEDAEIFYYPNAINAIQTLAIQSDVKDRKITKARFLIAVNRKDIVFSLWLRQKFGDEYYAKLIKRKHFKFASTKVPKASRIFVIDMDSEFDLAKTVEMLARIGTGFSHVEHARTPAQDRFCPYVLLLGLSPPDLVSLKGCLVGQGISISDGHAFNGAAFSPVLLAAPPTKDHQIRLKFIPSVDDIAQVVFAINGTVVELFDFFKSSPLDTVHIPSGVPHHRIKVDGSYFINEVL